MDFLILAPPPGLDRADLRYQGVWEGWQGVGDAVGAHAGALDAGAEAQDADPVPRRHQWVIGLPFGGGSLDGLVWRWVSFAVRNYHSPTPSSQVSSAFSSSSGRGKWSWSLGRVRHLSHIHWQGVEDGVGISHTFIGKVWRATGNSMVDLMTLFIFFQPCQSCCTWRACPHLRVPPRPGG